MKELFKSLVKRKQELEDGIIPFVEPNSIEEDLAFQELFFVNKQIGVLHNRLKEAV